jgi:phosphatidate cytidylyltransferase
MGTESEDSAASPMRRANSLAQRVGSVAIMLPLAVAVMWWNHWAVLAAVFGLIIVGWNEVYTAFNNTGYQPQRWLGLAMALALAAAIFTDHQLQSHITPAIIVVGVMFGLAILLPYHDRKGVMADWAVTLGGACYIGGLASYIVLVRMIETPLQPGPLRDAGLAAGAGWLYMICAITWLQDAFAYFVGKSYGRNKMSPSLSPKKTWEGAAGGMVGAILGGVLAVLICGLPISLWIAALLGLVGGVTGPLGDLVESMIKRQAGLKDTSQLIPGHGGLLDRIDSFLFNVPILYYLILLVISGK